MVNCRFRRDVWVHSIGAYRFPCWFFFSQLNGVFVMPPVTPPYHCPGAHTYCTRHTSIHYTHIHKYTHTRSISYWKEHKINGISLDWIEWITFMSFYSLTEERIKMGIYTQTTAGICATCNCCMVNGSMTSQISNVSVFGIYNTHKKPLLFKWGKRKQARY